jgi:hypothetical protein
MLGGPFFVPLSTLSPTADWFPPPVPRPLLPCPTRPVARPPLGPPTSSALQRSLLFFFPSLPFPIPCLSFPSNTKLELKENCLHMFKIEYQSLICWINRYELKSVRDVTQNLLQHHIFSKTFMQY